MLAAEGKQSPRQIDIKSPRHRKAWQKTKTTWLDLPEENEENEENEETDEKEKEENVQSPDVSRAAAPPPDVSRAAAAAHAPRESDIAAGPGLSGAKTVTGFTVSVAAPRRLSDSVAVAARHATVEGAAGGGGGGRCTQFTCLTGTHVQILTPEELCARRLRESESEDDWDSDESRFFPLLLLNPKP